jgi:hypothetical protein
MNRINTTADLMFAIAAALEEGDLEALERAARECRDWMTDRSEANARELLIEAVRGAIYERL